MKLSSLGGLAIAIGCCAGAPPALCEPETPALATPAPSIDGDYWGLITAGGGKVRLGIHLHTAQGGVSTLDSPDQGARGLPLSNIKVEGAKALTCP